MTRKLSIVVLITLGLFLATLLSRNAALAWMTIPFLCYLVAGVLTSPLDVRLSASRTLNHFRCEAGTRITMTVTIMNDGPTVPCLRVQEQMDPKFRILDGVDGRLGSLQARGKTDLQYTFQAPRGEYHWDKVNLTVSDPFGLFEIPLELIAKADVLVLPDRQSIFTPVFNPRYTLHAPGLYLSRQPGSGVNFLGVREYHPGDPLRWIHWRLSARHPKKLFTKEFEREEMADIGLILDGNSASNLKFRSEELFEYSIQAASALARIVLQAGNRLSLLVLGEMVVRVFPGAGKHQLELVLNKLAASQPGENASLNIIKYLPVRLFPSHALIIIVSTLCESDLPAITRLLASGYQVLVVSPDPIKFSCRYFHQPLAVRAATVERAALLWRIRKMGVPVFDWPIPDKRPVELERQLL